MPLSDFYPISKNEIGDTDGLVWSGEVVPGKYFAELQTSIIPQLVHLIIFDSTKNNNPVYTTLAAFEVGDILNSENMSRLNAAISIGLTELMSNG